MSWAAAVLAGGASRRMGGRDKASIEVEGEKLLDRQVRILREAGAQRVFIVGRPRHPPFLPPSCRFIPDDPRTSGPLAGLLAALAAAPEPLVAVSAVDLPALTPDWWRRLASRTDAAHGAVARNQDHYEPLAAIYPRCCLPAVHAYAAAGRRDLQGLVRVLAASDHLRVFDVPAGEASLLTNWNRPEDLPDAPR